MRLDPKPARITDCCKLKGVTHAPSALCPLRGARTACDEKAPCCGVCRFRDPRHSARAPAGGGFGLRLTPGSSTPSVLEAPFPARAEIDRDELSGLRALQSVPRHLHRAKP